MSMTPEPALPLATTRVDLGRLIELSPLPSWVFDEETFAFLAVNEAAVREYGWTRDEFLAMRLGDIRPPEDAAQLAGIQLHGISPQQRPNAWTHRLKDGTERPVQIVSQPLLLDGRAARLVHALDLTERVRVEQLFRESQKLEPLGLLAGGIAHDFNNVLTAIVGHASFLQEDIDATDPRHLDVAEIARAGQRAATLTRHLLSFSRKRKAQPVALDLVGAIETCASLLRRVLPADIRLRTIAAEHDVFAKMDPSQFEQLMLNLVLNARDAMPSGGELTLRACTVSFDDDIPVQTGPALRQGDYALVEVTDTGSGIAPEIADRIFQPFFTTKADGGGTGLGLASVRQLVMSANGGVQVHTIVGRGSTFTVLLPATHGAPEGPGDDGNPDLRGRGQVLVCDDDEAVAAYIARSLRRLGYEVHVAHDGTTARHRAAALGPHLSILVIDEMLPDVRGHALAAELVDQNPDLAVVLITGAATEENLRQSGVPSTMLILRKPFTPRALGAALRRTFRY